MIKLKSTLNFVAVFSVLFGLVVVIGCGSSAEKKVMSDFLKQYSETVNEYANSDASKRAELKEKLDSFKGKWTEIKIELGGQVTPQVIDEMDKEYDLITKKYSSLAG